MRDAFKISQKRVKKSMVVTKNRPSLDEPTTTTVSTKNRKERRQREKPRTQQSIAQSATREAAIQTTTNLAVNGTGSGHMVIKDLVQRDEVMVSKCAIQARSNGAFSDRTHLKSVPSSNAKFTNAETNR